MGLPSRYVRRPARNVPGRPAGPAPGPSALARRSRGLPDAGGGSAAGRGEPPDGGRADPPPQTRRDRPGKSPAIPPCGGRNSARSEGPGPRGPDVEPLPPGGPPVRPLAGRQRPHRPQPVLATEATQRQARPAPPAGRVGFRRIGLAPLGDRCEPDHVPGAYRAGPGNAVPRGGRDRLPGRGIGRTGPRPLRPGREHAGCGPPRRVHEEPEGGRPAPPRPARRRPPRLPRRPESQVTRLAGEVGGEGGRHAAGGPRRRGPAGRGGRSGGG